MKAIVTKDIKTDSGYLLVKKGREVTIDVSRGIAYVSEPNSNEKGIHFTIERDEYSALC